MARDGGERGVEFDADDVAEVVFAGDEQTAAFAGADVDEGVAGDGVGRDGFAPLGDERAEDGGCDAVVGGDVLVVGVAGDEVFGGDEAAGVDAVHLVEGVLGRRWRRHDEGGFGFAGRLRHVLDLADLDQVRVGVEAQGFTAGGGDVEGGPWGIA